MSPRAMLAFLQVTLGTRRACVATVTPVALVAVWLAWVDANEVAQAIALALFVQMFAAATGYRERARRGHFDPALTLGSSKETLAGVHWLLSIAPGAAAWVLAAAAVGVAHPTAWPPSVTPSGLAAFAYVSCAAWVCSLPLTRYISGVLWLVALFVLGGAGGISALRETFLAAGPGWNVVFTRTCAALVCPFLLLSDPEAAGPGVIGLVFFISALLAAYGVRFIAQLDVPLGGAS